VVRGKQGRVPVDRRKGVENTASFKANGTGPFRLKERQPGTRTVLVRNLNYWDKVDTNVDEVVFTPIGNDATRVAALLSGEIDVMEPVPLQDVERVKANPNAQGACKGPSCARSSSAWTRSATNCCSPA
jgi:peptide/nickel transport system substrate-binding protein